MRSLDTPLFTLEYKFHMQKPYKGNICNRQELQEKGDYENNFYLSENKLIRQQLPHDLSTNISKPLSPKFILN